MNTVLRRISVTVVALGVAGALLVAMAGPANAATSTVKLRNQATGAKLMTKDPSSLVTMKPAGAANQTWVKTDVSAGFATYSIGTGCLTGRGLQGFPLVTVEKCIPGKLAQQWRKGVSGDLQLRLNGLIAEVNTSSAAFGVRMAFFTAKPNQKWTILPA
jgi:hypothetical protein